MKRHFSITRLRLNRRPRGLATIEAALIFPFLLTLTFGLIEYGWMFLKQEQVTNTARQATRLAALIDTHSSQVTTEISTMMTGYGFTSSQYTATVTPTEVYGAARGTQVTVRISVPYSGIELTGFTLLPVPSTISATVTMNKEGT